MPTCATTRGSSPTASSPCGFAGSRAGAAIRTSCTSAATPRCAATITSGSSATRAFFANAELRFPLIEAMLTPVGVLGGLRGVMFINVGGDRLQRHGNALHGARTGSTGRSSPTRSSISSARSSRCTARNWHRRHAAASTAAPPTASASRARCSGSRCTSTGPGRRCSTAAGKTPLRRRRLVRGPERQHARQRLVPPDELHVLDRLRLVITPGTSSPAPYSLSRDSATLENPAPNLVRSRGSLAQLAR